MRRIPGGVLSRAVIGAVIALTAIATVAAAPAGAASRQDDPLSVAAYQSLLDLQAAQDRQVPTGDRPRLPIGSRRGGGDGGAPDGVGAGRVRGGVERGRRRPHDGVALGAGRSRRAVPQPCVELRRRLRLLGPHDVRVGAGRCRSAPQRPRPDGRVGRRVRGTPRSPGDLVEYPGHVMMYVGAGHAIVARPAQRCMDPRRRVQRSPRRAPRVTARVELRRLAPLRFRRRRGWGRCLRGATRRPVPCAGR